MAISSLTAPPLAALSATLSDREAFLADTVAGLSSPRKTLPSKWFYDAAGSAIFDKICELPEYYPTRCELEIMREQGQDIASCVGSGASILEFGSGSSLKTRLLLRALHQPASYYPLDISKEHLHQSAAELAAEFPGVRVVPVCADYTRPYEVPTGPYEQLTAYFPGSTLGNFLPAEAEDFLWNCNRLVGPGGSLLIGIDLRKDPDVLRRAYNDEAGVTALFNLNLLHRINRELDGDFQVDQFEHRAVWNAAASRIEMRLYARRPQQVRVGPHRFDFAADESILTEYSHKYSDEQFASLVGRAGWRVCRSWTDRGHNFSVKYLVAC